MTDFAETTEGETPAEPFQWVLIKSWHRLAGWESRGGQPRTLCGRFAAKGSPEATEFPLFDKSCETCLRIETRRG